MESPTFFEAVRNDSVPRRRIQVIFNPAAGRQRVAKLRAVLAHLNALADVAVIETNAPGHAEQLAAQVDPQKLDVIVAAGGDGTVNEVVNGLSGRDVALGVIPLGTANVLADEIGIPRKPAHVAEMLANGPIRPIRVGRANGRRFVMMVGAGFDANVVDGVSLALKKKVGPLAYVWQTMKLAFGSAPPPPLDLVVDGTARRTASVVICNGRHYGGRFIAAPEASLHDDAFHVVQLKNSGWLSVARYGAALLGGFLPKLSDVEITPARTVDVRGGTGAPVQADGDIITRLPMTVSVDPVPVRLVHPL